MAYEDTSTLYGDVVTLAGLTFNGAAGVADQTVFIADVLAGWDGSPVPRARVNNRPNRHGAYRNSRAFFNQRELVMEGALVADTRQAFLTARARLMRAVSVTGMYTLTRTDPVLGQLSLDVYLNGQIEFTNDLGMGCRYSIPLIAPDPIKQSPQVARAVVNMQIPQDYVRTYAVSGADRVRTYTASGADYVRTYTRVAEYTPGPGYIESSQLTNTGNADAWPISYVTGPLQRGWYIENNSINGIERLIFDTEILDGQVLVIDHRERTAVLNNGQNTHVEATARGTWWSIHPGQNTYRLNQSRYNNRASLQLITAESAWS